MLVALGMVSSSPAHPLPPLVPGGWGARSSKDPPKKLARSRMRLHHKSGRESLNCTRSRERTHARSFFVRTREADRRQVKVPYSVAWDRVLER